ncbi:MAG TPA: DUF2721 domain-containing protein [Vicinamibacterales bacterium]|nr:DUF2721 domain-containing protein [Vicinamibacterales bacterium]
MNEARLAELVPLLQVAIGPAILISAVGLLLLTMTNRFGRIVDRSHVLAVALRSDVDADRSAASSQIDVLWKRALLARRAILFGCLSALFDAALIIVLFVAAVGRYEIAVFVAGLFAACLLTLIVSLVFFLQELTLSLEALKLDLFGLRQ